MFRPCNECGFQSIDLFTNTAAILNSIVSNGYYGMLREQMHTNLPPEHPIISLKINRNQNGHLIGKKVNNLGLPDYNEFTSGFL